MDLLNFETLPQSLQKASFIKELKMGQRLFRQGDTATALYIVKTGRLRLVRSTIESQKIALQFVSSGNCVGETALLHSKYSYTAIAEVAAKVIVYPKQELTIALQEYSNLADNAIALLLEKINSLEVNLELRGIRSAHQRIHRYLQYSTTPERENIVNLDRHWKEIADELDCSPHTLSRALAKLQREGRIDRAGQINLTEEQLIPLINDCIVLKD
jgi:CRP/FNR family transcriptional regulator, dissimilatory nitrate respiration regulator